MSDAVFAAFPAVWRLQLMIETWNVASWKLAERCAFVREGLLMEDTTLQNLTFRGSHTSNRSTAFACVPIKPS